MKIVSYGTSKPIDGLCKQSAVWMNDDSGSCAPLIYLQRPKWIKDDAVWETVTKAVRINLPQGFEVL